MCAKISQAPKTDTCPQCHMSFEAITTHWDMSSECSFPKLPRQVKDIIYGIFSVRGSLETRNRGRRNRISVNSTRLDALEQLRSVLGVYTTRTPIVEKRNSSERFGESVNKNYVLKLRPIPNIQSKPQFNNTKGAEYASNGVFMKTAFLLQGRVNNGSASMRIAVDKARKKGSDMIFKEFFRNRWVEDREGENYVTYSSPYDEVKNLIATDWPRGWWNREYM